MSRDYRLYLDDIIEATRRIKEFTNRMDFDAFKADIKTQDAVVRNLEIIGEAAGRLPEAVRQAAAEIEWRKVVGIRNILALGILVSVCRLSGMLCKTSWTSCPMHVRVL